MKHIFVLLLAAMLLSAMTSNTHATEPDTIWTQGPNLKCWFTPDGTKILSEYPELLNVSDGSVVWTEGNGYSNGIFSQDSLYFYDRQYAKYRISDGVKVAVGPDFRFDTLPDFFSPSSSILTEPKLGLDIFMMPDENTFFYMYSQNLLSLRGEYIASRSLLCKYDKSLDSIVLYKPLVKGTDTLLRSGSAGFWVMFLRIILF